MKLSLVLGAWLLALSACANPPPASLPADAAPIVADHVVVLVHGLSCPN